MATVLNFSLSAVFRFASAEPTVMKRIAISMVELCSIAKKRISRIWTSICDMVEKKRRDRADEVEPHADDELDMGDGRGVVAYAILKNAKFTPL